MNYNVPYSGYSPVNIYQNYPQNEELKKIENEYREKLAVAMGIKPKQQVQQEQNQDYQKLILQFLEEVYNIPEKEFSIGFEEYIEVVNEREKKEEDDIKRRVRDKVHGKKEGEKDKKQLENLEEGQVKSPPSMNVSGNKYKKGGA